MNYVSFQAGTLVKRPNRSGFTWVLRYTAEGKRKAMVLGTNEELPTEAAARRKASTMTAVINDPHQSVTLAQLIEKYIKDELPFVRAATASSYGTSLALLKAKYGDWKLPELLKDLMAIGTWLGELETQPRAGAPARPMSKKSRQHVKALLHRLIECAMRWRYLPMDVNPISKVEIRIKKGIVLPRKRGKYPLSAEQIKKLFEWPDLAEHVRVMVKLCVFLGLRISEVLALRWESIDLENGVVEIMRSAVGKDVDETKTPNSDTKLALHPVIVETLNAWRKAAPEVNGWVFGNMVTGRPFHRDSLQADHLKPAGLALGIPNLGWHSFRHTQIALLRANGTPAEVQMMLMRHADMRTTNEYGRDDGSLDLKRAAHERMVDALLKDIAG
jgi:integrase